MPQIQISNQNSRLTLTKSPPETALWKLMAVFSKTAREGTVFVFDRASDTLSRDGKTLCALSQFQSARIDKRVGVSAGNDSTGSRYGLSILLVSGQKITLVDAFEGENLEDMNRIADAISRYTDISVHREA